LCSPVFPSSSPCGSAWVADMSKPFTLLAVLWALVIFAGASVQPPPGPCILFEHEDKIIHFLEYAILTFLIYKAFIHAPKIRIARRSIAWSVAIGFCYGALLEMRQCWLPYRECSMADLAANWTGVAVMALFARNKGCLRARRMRERRLAGRSAAP